jgi:FdrA protein
VGISQGIGTGCRDLNKEVGGIMMLQALEALQQDPATQILILISKPPAKEVARTVLEKASTSNKPTVVCFLGGEMDSLVKAINVSTARTLQECSLLAAGIFRHEGGGIQALFKVENARLARKAKALRTKLGTWQRYLRGLFSGGTLCYEAQVIWKDISLKPIHSNAPLPGGQALSDSTRSIGHTVVDLGEEEFTVGRPHPMIDNDLRIRRLLQEARDPEVAVILLDMVLGYGAHPDPAAELGPAIRQARGLAKIAKRELHIITSITGTEGDPQDFRRTASILKAAGAIVCDSNAAAARLSGMIVSP